MKWYAAKCFTDFDFKERDSNNPEITHYLLFNSFTQYMSRIAIKLVQNTLLPHYLITLDQVKRKP